MKEQNEECFINDSFQQQYHTQPLDFKIQIHKKINQQMPANELRTIHRPNNMHARTFYLDRPLYLLNQSLNQSQNQFVNLLAVGLEMSIKQKLKICNSKNVNIEQYFSSKKFRMIYNKLNTYRNDRINFLGKLKGIDSLIDYNWKSFKQLEKQQKSIDQSIQNIDSDFECGNICRVYLRQGYQRQYYLLIQNDLNTYGYNNWFFFRIKNSQKGNRKFNICNFIKKTNFWNQGMLISIFSMKRKQKLGQGWFKGGENITFGMINLKRQHHQNQNYYCLYFQYHFQYQNDEVYFSLNQPYTYTRLIKFINKAVDTTINARIKIQVKQLGYSIANNIIPLIRIYDEKITNNENIILILGRQHPCETVGSFLSQKIIEYFLIDNEITINLLSLFQIYIIPMINPDGVIHGMSRTNMSGLDLNRHWGQNILKQLTPETIRIKQFITTISKNKKIKYMIDLHGHGKKLNSFFFCSKGGEKEKSSNQLLTICMKELEKRFSFYNCTFGITKDKENTIRSQLIKLGIKNSYTLETSLYGWKNAQNQIKHFNESDYKQISQNLIKSIFLLQSSSDTTYQYLALTKDIILKQIPLILQISQKEQKMIFQNSEIMSDSDPQGDRLDMKDLLSKCQNKLIKKKLQQSYTKKNIIKKYKKLSTVQEYKNSNKNLSLRESYTPGLQTTYQVTANQFHPKKEFVRLSDNSKSKYKTMRTVKVYDRKDKQDISKSQKNNQLIQSLNLTKNHLRPRLKTQPTTNEIRLKTSKIKFHHEIQNSSLRTQKVQLKTQCKTQPDELIPYQKSQIQLTLDELKRQSISMLMTDTIPNIKTNKKDKNISISRLKNNKNGSIQITKQTCRNETTQKLQAYGKSINKEVVQSNCIFTKIRLFRNLNVKSSYGNKFRGQINSVYYHFPIL